MVDNTLGTFFKITSFGESHGDLIGIIVDGTPAGIELDLELIQQELGIFNKKTTGAPICLTIENKDVDSSKYEEFKKILRPSHVDYSALMKYGHYYDYRGSGRFSGRITAGFVMAGAIAKQILKKYNITIFAYTKSIGNIIDEEVYNTSDYERLLELRENSLVRTLSQEKSKLMEILINEVKAHWWIGKMYS